MTNSGYRYTIEDDKIKEYMKLTVEEKLAWLAEINELTRLTLTESELEFRDLLRSGKI